MISVLHIEKLYSKDDSEYHDYKTHELIEYNWNKQRLASS
jgi:hypothetical protein